MEVSKCRLWMRLMRDLHRYSTRNIYNTTLTMDLFNNYTNRSGSRTHHSTVQYPGSSPDIAFQIDHNVELDFCLCCYPNFVYYGTRFQES